ITQYEYFFSIDLLHHNCADVPEGSFIVRAHTPMSNLFSCLWFNEVNRFTSRDQLSFAYTYLKLRRMNTGKPFHLNMFKDCERRAITKLFHHRANETADPPPANP
ncbi:Os02g0745800, partial [Oryza sativa Japonica Group]